MHRRCAVGGPAGVGNAGAAFQMGGGNLLHQLGDPRGAARTLQAVGVDRNAARVVAPVLQPGQALHQNGHDVLIGYGADDATHKTFS